MNHRICRKCFVVFIIYFTVKFLILGVFVYYSWLFCPFVFMSAAFFFESAICNSWLFWEYLINIYKNKSAYLCVNIYLLSMIPKNCLSFMYKNKEGQKQYLFYQVIINLDFHIWEFLLSSLLSGLIFIVNKFDNKYWKARIYFTISSHCEKSLRNLPCEPKMMILSLWWRYEPQKRNVFNFKTVLDNKYPFSESQ